MDRVPLIPVDKRRNWLRIQFCYGNCELDFLWIPLAAHIEMHHDDVIKWKHFPRYWPFVQGIHRSPVNSPHKGQWRGALIFSLICTWINGWVNNWDTGDLRHHRTHYDVTVMMYESVNCIIDLYNTEGEILSFNDFLSLTSLWQLPVLQDTNTLRQYDISVSV